MNWKPPMHRHSSGCYTHSKNLISMRRLSPPTARGASLKGQLFASTDLRLNQTNDWPVPPDKGYPTLDKELPEKRWHFTAETERVERCRIAAIFSVRGPGESDPDFSITASENQIALSAGNTTAQINLSPDESTVLSLSSGPEKSDHSVLISRSII